MKLIFPMGAKDYKDELRVKSLLMDNRYGIELKVDGCRGVLYFTTEGIKVYGRKCGVNDKTKPLEMTHNLPTLSSFKVHHSLVGFALDVEIYHPNKSAAEIAGAISPNRKLPPIDWENEIRYYCFDLPLLVVEDKPWQENTSPLLQRKSQLTTFYNSEHLKLECLELSKLYTHSDFPHPYERLQEWLEEGKEGGVIKKLNSLYHFSYEEKGKKPNDVWVKAKKQLTRDVILVGFKEPTKYYTGKNLKNWQYWELENDSLYHGDKIEDMASKPITKHYYHSLIGGFYYAYLMTQNDIKKYNIKEYYTIEEVLKNKQINDIKLNNDFVEELKKINPYLYLGIVGSSTGIDDELRFDISSNKSSFVGRVMELEAMEEFDNLVLRHPRFIRFRDDLSLNDCFVGVKYP